MVDAFHITVLVERGKARIGHANLFALINVRCTAQAMDDCTQHLGRLCPVFVFVSKAGDDARLVMVAPEYCVPGVVFAHTSLPRE